MELFCPRCRFKHQFTAWEVKRITYTLAAYASATAPPNGSLFLVGNNIVSLICFKEITDMELLSPDISGYISNMEAREKEPNAPAWAMQERKKF